MKFIYSPKYQKVVPVIARVIFGVFFLFAASSKIPGTAMFDGGVSMLASKGIPFASTLVVLALILELIAGLALISGLKARVAAFVLIPYVVLLTVLFHLDFSTDTGIGFFVDHILLIAGLMTVSALIPEKK